MQASLSLEFPLEKVLYGSQSTLGTTTVFFSGKLHTYPQALQLQEHNEDQQLQSLDLKDFGYPRRSRKPFMRTSFECYTGNPKGLATTFIPYAGTLKWQCTNQNIPQLDIQE
ncbi:hypothetical protein VitviT2T_018259 [Vitis vinifera]|uniref:Uncharacterized protein n=1 Tax=Vitis vinifera TaxID=29760 RepID=A0ABY9D003_VITVI|nr:hypothetical protein VitviT2T_018259 [Vitis vinifera]